MDKIDLKKQLKSCYSAKPDESVVVQVPRLKYIMTDGKGDPNTAMEFKTAIETLYAIAYKIKAINKANPETPDYVVMPFEAQWWADNVMAFINDDRTQWMWTAMIAQPNFITKQIFMQAKRELAKENRLFGLRRVRYGTLKDGMSAQIMHLGPFINEGDTIEKLHEFIFESDYKLAGKHHEIYLSDMRKPDPSKWRTIIRQPVLPL